MARTNFTGEEYQQTSKELFCSAELTGEVQNHRILLSALHICLSITTFLGNTLILVALHKESSLHPPSKLLYRSLAMTDLCVGIIVDPLSVAAYIALINEQWNVCHYAYDAMFITGCIFCTVSLLSQTAISVDRLLALLLGLRYRHIVTLKRTYVAVAVFWVASASVVTLTTYFSNLLITAWCGNILALLCTVTSIFCYTKIFLTLRHNQMQVRNQVSRRQPSQTIPLNIARYRKAVSTALWVQITSVVCYLPWGIAVNLPFSVYLARQYTACLIYLNSSLNPLLFCWKIKEVKQAVKDTIRQLKLSCSSS